MSDALHASNPIETILARVAEEPVTAESQTLLRSVISLIRNQDDVTVSELCALSAEALDLIHAFAQECLKGRYERAFLEGVAASLVSKQGRNFRPVRIAA